MLCTQISLNLIVVLFQIPLFYYRSASLEKPSSSTPSSGHSELTISSDKSELPRGGGEYCMCIVSRAGHTPQLSPVTITVKFCAETTF